MQDTSLKEQDEEWLCLREESLSVTIPKDYAYRNMIEITNGPAFSKTLTVHFVSPVSSTVSSSFHY